MAAAAMLTASRENHLAIAVSLFGRTSQQYLMRWCRGQHVRFEGLHATRQVSFACFLFVCKINVN